VPAPNLVAWIEDRTGIDVTPCHAGDGSWAPTPGCGALFAGTEADASWAAGCPGPVSPPSQRCGPAWTSLEDSEAPSVRFVEPVDQAVFEAAPVEFDVLAEAEDAGVGVRELRLLVDGEPWLDRFGREGFDQVPPYRFEAVRFEVEGPHTLTLVAVDHFDNVGTVSATIFVGELPGDTGGDDETETDTGGVPPSPSEPGCACASGPASSGPLGLSLVLLSGLWALLSAFWAWGPRCRRSPRAAFHRRR
jgi:hypothetical protein